MPKKNAFEPSSTLGTLSSVSGPTSASSAISDATATTIGGTMNNAMIPAVANERRGVNAATARPTEASTPAVSSDCARTGGNDGRSSRTERGMSVATRARPMKIRTWGPSRMTSIASTIAASFASA